MSPDSSNRSIRIFLRLVHDFKLVHDLKNDAAFLSLIHWTKDTNVISEIRSKRISYIRFDLLTHVLAYLPIEDTRELAETYWDEVMPKEGHNSYTLMPINPDEQQFIGWLRDFKRQSIDNQHALRDITSAMERLKHAGPVFRNLLDIMAMEPGAYSD